ncbi:MAG: exo-alpha-sialidase, partial [Clostridia bacterium]|nr:exo-alpha-sialidase [Clostridia bacterium]
MKKHNGWSYAPYKPPFIEVGDIYICRVVPKEASIRFEWLEDVGECSVYLRKKGESEFRLKGKTSDCFYVFDGLDTDTDYEFYVSHGDKRSRVRLARTGKSVGTTVNYLHPEDEAYCFSGRYLCSPSLVRHPDGYLLASMDIYDSGAPQNLTLIYRSDDDGETWSYVSELFPCFWGKMFIYNGELYMLSVSTEYGDLLIGRSTDGAKTFTEPVVLLRGGNGKKGIAGVHKNPEPMFEFGGRLWGTIEWGAWGSGYHAPMVMSAP